MNLAAVVKNSAQEFRRIVKREIDFYRVKPTHVLLFLTFRCPSHCRTCEIWKWEEMGLADRTKELGLEEWKRFIDMMAEIGISNVEIFGGEALLRRDVVPPLVRYITDKGIEADVVTNGLTMNEQLAQELVEAGLHDLYFSVDGVGELHDYVRRVEGNFEKIERGIQYVLKARGEREFPKITCNCTISALNVDAFEKVVDFAAESGVDGVHFEYAGQVEPVNIDNSVIDGVPAHPYFHSHEGGNFLLSREQAILLKQKIAAIRSTAKKLDIGVKTINIDNLTVEDLTTGVFPNKKCYMIRYFVAIDPYGNIMGCPFFNDYHIGNFREQHVRSIWNNKKHRQFMKAQKRGDFEMCKNCVMGVQRNITFFESLRAWYRRVTKKGKDPDGFEN
jgi:MoaA/NifB/PqqE/SkfB family radical SAM enzyme